MINLLWRNAYLVIVAAIVFTLVRPKSQAAAAAVAMMNAFANLVREATGANLKSGTS